MAMYSLVEGFTELDTISLKKATNYCYSVTYDKCCGTDDCYLCTS